MSQESQKVDTGELSRAFPDLFPTAAAVASVEKLAGDASSRRYYRVSSSGPGRSYILQVADPFGPDEEVRHPFLSLRSLFEAWDIRVPKLFGTKPELGWVLLEDLGDATLQSDKKSELYKRSIDQMILWTWKSAGAHEDLVHFHQAFDFEKLQAEMTFTDLHFVKGMLNLDQANFLDLVSANSRYLDRRPRFLAHRDYHSRNIMLRKSEIYVIDFQDARMGPVSYDIVSLLWDPYVRLSELERLGLLNYWRAELLKCPAAAIFKKVFGEAKGLAEWQVELERMKIQRLLKAVGSYASFYRLKGRRDYLPSVRPALEDTKSALRTLKAGGAALESDDKLLNLLESLNLEPVDKLGGT